jgi:6,7-dimethyl-8-ribityllumazine synthase
MSAGIPDRPEPLPNSRHFAVVASRYNKDYVDGMAESALAELAVLAPGSDIEVLRVPGAFEIPLAAQKLASSKKVDAIFAFGVIWKGETAHADLLATSVTNALLDISLRFEIPILNEVLVLETEAQARVRCMPGGELNRGVEAARSAVRMLTMLDEVAEDAAQT